MSLDKLLDDLDAKAKTAEGRGASCAGHALCNPETIRLLADAVRWAARHQAALDAADASAVAEADAGLDGVLADLERHAEKVVQ